MCIKSVYVYTVSVCEKKQDGNMLGEGDIVEYQVEYDPRKGFFPPLFSKTEGKKML